MSQPIMFLVGICAVVWGCVKLFRPQWFYQKTERWKSDRDAGPSTAFIHQARFMGGIFVAAGLTLMIGPFITGL